MKKLTEISLAQKDTAPIALETSINLITNHKSQNKQKKFKLSVIIRTQGKRMVGLEEALTSLVAQDSENFEIVIVKHNVAIKSSLKIDQLIFLFPKTFQAKITVVESNGGTRTRPLNEGFSRANGTHIAIFDDDDIVFSHWVSTFEKMSAKDMSRVLRATTVRQSVEPVTIRDCPAIRAVGGLDLIYPNTFNLLSHLVNNESPPISLAFPAYLFNDLDIIFDEELNTQEDWDFLMNCVMVAGIETTTEITSIYRWWHQGPSSRTIHSKKIWEDDYSRITKKLASRETRLPVQNYYDQVGHFQGSKKATPAISQLERLFLSRKFKLFLVLIFLRNPLNFFRLPKQCDLEFMSKSEKKIVYSLITESKTFDIINKISLFKIRALRLPTK